MIIYLPLLVCFAGGLIYLLCNGPSPTSPKVAEIGRMMFWCGLLAFLLTAPGHMVSMVH
jgi:hypothetical protein